MFLSVLIPSNRPEGLEKTIKSLRELAAKSEDIEIVSLVDDDKNYVEYHSNEVVVHRIPTQPLSVATMMEECYKVSSGEWIFFGNDDAEMKTKDWDIKVKVAAEKFPDKIAMIWPNDGMFGDMMACFPIVSRKMIDLVRLFPTPYRRYKLDDTINEIIPPARRIFLHDVVFRHHNDEATEGFKLPTGKFYPIDKEAANYDTIQWMGQGEKRNAMRLKLAGLTYAKSAQARIMIGTPTAGWSKNDTFYDHYNMLDKPIGTMCTFARGQSPARNRNLIIEQAITNGCTHILFLDDDLAFKPDTLTRLLAHDKDVVTGLYLMRNYPHKPIVFDYTDVNGRCRHYFPPDGVHGLIPITNCGLGAVLIKTEVFRAVESPWITLGELERDQWCDDISFFNRVRAKGFEMFCDLDCLVGHMGNVVVWPNYVNDAWHTTYDTSGSAQVTFPLVRPNPEELAVPPAV